MPMPLFALSKTLNQIYDYVFTNEGNGEILLVMRLVLGTNQ